MPGVQLALTTAGLMTAAVAIIAVSTAISLGLAVRLITLLRTTPRSERWFGWPLKDRWVRWLLAGDVLCCTAIACLLVVGAATGAFGVP
jgi:hypothetical protein